FPTFPAGQTLTITIGTAKASATIDGVGNFHATISSSQIAASSTPYTITYSYAGDSNFKPATDSSTTLTVNKAATEFLGLSSQSMRYGENPGINLLGAIRSESSTTAAPGGETMTITIGNVTDKVTVNDGGLFNVPLQIWRLLPASSTPYTI